jgi:hypothetical protein
MSLLALLLACSEYEMLPEVDDGDPVCPAPTTVPEALDPLATCATEPTVGQFTPTIQWNWTDNPVNPGYQEIMAAPAVANLTDDNGDGRIDERDVPDVVFTAFIGGAYTSAGALVAISGDDGRTLWSLTDVAGHAPYSSSGVAIADLDGDGVPSVIVSAVDGLLAVDASGAFEWLAPVSPYPYGHPAVADVDGDGIAEVVYGPTLVNGDGTVRWTGAGGNGVYISFADDLDGDGLSEIIAGNTVYNVDGSVRWTDGGPDGFPAVADIDMDGSPDMIRVGGGIVRVTHADGTPMWDFAITDGGGGPPTVADFDGDGAPEIGVASRSVYRVIEAEGTERWENVVQDYSSSVTGSSVFDFEGDGAAEVVYADEQTLWIYDGATGAVEMAWDSHASGTLFEYPLIVDVDHDGATEIVVASNDYAFAGSRGITVIGDAEDTWAPGRPVWNQHAYSISNVLDDGTVPVHAAPNWDRWNSFRAGNSQSALGLDEANLVVGEPDDCTLECANGVVVVYVPVSNNGIADAENVDVTVYAQHGNTEQIAGSVTVDHVPAGQTVWAGPLVLVAGEGGRSARIVVDDARRVRECDETDNEIAWDGFSCAP